MRILAISGSLRALSFNTAALQASAVLAPAGLEIVLYVGMGDLPHFNPDLDTDEPPESVKAFRREVGTSDGLLLAAPEYAHGIAGAFKNALDWLVSCVEFPDKPVALINASERATHAQGHLREILATMSARLIDRASITLPLMGRNLDAAGILADPELSGQLQAALAMFLAEINALKDGSERGT
ncbi:MAG TPA: NADPH-dependent FMN reductase [Aestuariivirga sp.]|nr:NADPH-dependent FMN reductase [Aestuariivirga sp.]